MEECDSINFELKFKNLITENSKFYLNALKNIIIELLTIHYFVVDLSNFWDWCK